MSQKRAFADCAGVVVASSSLRYFVGDIETVDIHQIIHHTQVIAFQHIQHEVDDHERVVHRVHVQSTITDDVSGRQIQMNVFSIGGVRLFIVHSVLGDVKAAGDKELSEVDVDLRSVASVPQLWLERRFIDDPTTSYR